MIETFWIVLWVVMGFGYDIRRMIAYEARYCRSPREATLKLLGVPPTPGPYLVLPEPSVQLWTPGVDYGPATICVSRGHFMTIASGGGGGGNGSCSTNYGGGVNGGYRRRR